MLLLRIGASCPPDLQDSRMLSCTLGAESFSAISKHQTHRVSEKLLWLISLLHDLILF